MSIPVKTKTMLAVGVVTLIALTLLAGTAGAIPIATGVDFSGGSGGTLSYTSGLGNALSVTGATIDSIKQRPSNSSFAIVGGLLDLVTGGCATDCSINLGTGDSNPHFSDGGSISITGSIPSLPGDPSGTLISGTWDSTLSIPQFGKVPCTATEATLNPNTGGVGMNGCALITFINPLLATDLNFPSGTGDGFLAELFFDVTLTGNTYSGEIMHSDFNLVPVPEPASLALLGAGLLVLGGLGRKKLRAVLGAR